MLLMMDSIPHFAIRQENVQRSKVYSSFDAFYERGLIHMLNLDVIGNVSSIASLAISIISFAYSFQHQKKMSHLPQTGDSSEAEDDDLDC